MLRCSPTSVTAALRGRFVPASLAGDVIDRPRIIKAELTCEKWVDAEAEGKCSATNRHYTRPDPFSFGQS
jgi:hypothetical protein